jgi:hypothetical protein
MDLSTEWDAILLTSKQAIFSIVHGPTKVVP